LKLGKIGTILLGVWLILSGLSHVINFSIDGTIMAILAIAAGVLILLNK